MLLGEIVSKDAGEAGGLGHKEDHSAGRSLCMASLQSHHSDTSAD